MKSKIFATVFVVLTLFGCDDPSSTQSATNAVVETTSNPTTSEPQAITENIEPKPKTDAEEALEAFSTILDAASEALDDKRRNDSIKEANKDKVWAYQIGLEKTDKDDVFDTYNKLNALEISGLYVFRKARKDYIIVKYEAKPQSELNEGLDEFKTQIASVEPKVDVVNLMSFCSLKEVVKKDGEISKRKEDPIPCLTCLK